MERVRRNIQLLDKSYGNKKIYNGSFLRNIAFDISGYSFPSNTIADFRTKLATPLEFEHDKREVGLVEIYYPKGYKKAFLHNTLRLGSEENRFPVKH